MRMFQSPLDRLPRRDPAETARLQTYLAEMAARHRQHWPAIRKQMLAAAQRAQNVRSQGVLLCAK